jgi:hypothetical protein
MSQCCDDAKNNRLPILIQTVNSYSKEASLTAHQLKQFSLDSFCDVYISTNEDCKGFLPSRGINLIERGSGKCWSTDLDVSLAALDSEYVLFWLDDFVPIAIDEQRLQSIWEWFRSVKGDYIRLNPTPKGEGSLVHDGVRIIDAGESYRASTILAIWNVAFLRSILVSGESAWQFEFFGSVRSDISDGFYACETNVVEFVNLVIKGKILPSAEKKLNKLGVSTGMLERSRMSTHQRLKFNFTQLRSMVFGLVPSKLRRRLRLHFATDLKLESS